MMQFTLDTKATKNNVAAIYKEATDAAAAATRAYLAEYGEGAFNCGFAWVTIKPARGPMVAHLKSINVGRPGYEGGFQVWNPSGHPTQDMSAKFDGARAFAEVLRKYGINAQCSSRLD